MPSGTSSLVATVEAYIRRHRLLDKGAPVIVGLSGGADSVTLVDVLVKLGYPVHAFHLNHALRPSAADADEAFVRDLCERLHLPLTVERLEAGVLESDAEGMESAGRRARYAAMTLLATDEGITRVAVAHHLDDQAETVLMNLMRGSGPEGLRGMRPRRRLQPGWPVLLVRPLLCVSKPEIVAYATEAGLTWREDLTNTDTSRARSALRHDVVAPIRSHFGERAIRGMARSSALMRAYSESFARDLRTRFAACQAGDDSLDVAALKAQAAVWRSRILIEATRRFLGRAPNPRRLSVRLGALLDSQPGRKVVLADGAVWREGLVLRFVPGSATVQDPTFLDFERAAVVPRGTVSLTRLNERPSDLTQDTPGSIYVDSNLLKLPLVVRPWRHGDVFRPFGMNGSKRVSDLLTDCRVPSSRRHQVAVVCSGESIVWVVGIRADSRFCVRDDTRSFAKMTFRSAP